MAAIETRYIIVSPLKDEAPHVEHTLESVTNQTLEPTAWIIVDDGSTDSSAAIVRRYAEAHPYIQLQSHDNIGARQPGAAVIHAFNRGYQAIGSLPFDFIVKLDCDLSFAPDYFERLLARFRADERLGIASGIYLELDKAGRWRPVKMPAYHAFGACKVVRRECFEEIGGFVAAKGWDTVDEIRAMSNGWTTTHFEDLETRHHKPEGVGIGVLRTSKMHGEIYYVTGGDPLLFVLKSLKRLGTSPIPLNMFALIVGYLGAFLRRRPRLVTLSEARHYRALLRRRLVRSGKKPVAVE